jgi:hypothetical protein
MRCLHMRHSKGRHMTIPACQTTATLMRSETVKLATPIILDIAWRTDHGMCPGQEIGTHTFSHYYCLEPGQQPEQFEDDLKAAIAVSKAKGIDTKSIVFPRNQYSQFTSISAIATAYVTYRG